MDTHKNARLTRAEDGQARNAKRWWLPSCGHHVENCRSSFPPVRHRAHRAFGRLDSRSLPARDKAGRFEYSLRADVFPLTPETGRCRCSLHSNLFNIAPKTGKLVDV